MTKEEALELLKDSPLMEPGEGEDGETYCRHIGEYMGETDTNFCWAVYWHALNEPVDLTYAFPYFVSKNTNEVSHASAPLTKEYLKELQTGSK